MGKVVRFDNEPLFKEFASKYGINLFLGAGFSTYAYNEQCETLPLEYVVSQIAYLFKHDSYKHENEVRIIKTLSDNDVSDIRSISGEIPRLYVYNDVPTFIDEIILGARVKNPEEYVPFLCTHGRKMWGSKTEKQIKITHSSIQYR